MLARPERVLLFRSGRHLQVAIDAIRADAPGCDVTVVATPSAAAALDAGGVDATHRIVYDATPFFRPWPFLRHGAWRQAVGGAYDRVYVLWNDPEGAGHTNVDYTALTVAPGGFTAITPDGRLIHRRTGLSLRRAVARAVVSVVVGGALALALWVPARLAAALPWSARRAGAR